jgi:hypothetical protein
MLTAAAPRPEGSSMRVTNESLTFLLQGEAVCESRERHELPACPGPHCKGLIMLSLAVLAWGAFALPVWLILGSN